MLERRAKRIAYLRALISKMLKFREELEDTNDDTISIDKNVMMLEREIQEIEFAERDERVPQ